MFIMNRIEGQMTYSEQVELTRLEDEVAIAMDDIEFGDCDEDIDSAKKFYLRMQSNLNKYIDEMTKKYS